MNAWFNIFVITVNLLVFTVNQALHKPQQYTIPIQLQLECLDIQRNWRRCLLVILSQLKLLLDPLYECWGEGEAVAGRQLHQLHRLVGILNLL